GGERRLQLAPPRDRLPRELPLIYTDRKLRGDYARTQHTSSIPDTFHGSGRLRYLRATRGCAGRGRNQTPVRRQAEAGTQRLYVQPAADGAPDDVGGRDRLLCGAQYRWPRRHRLLLPWLPQGPGRRIPV